MKISVLIASHRDAPHLPEALASIAAQVHSDWELFVVEYEGRDEAEALVRQFSAGRAGVQYEYLPAAHVAAVARNRLLDLATGEAVAFLDAADVWAPRHLAIAAQQLGAGADVVVSDVRIVDLRTGRPVNDFVIPPQVSTSSTRTLFSRDAIPSTSCVVIRRQLITDIGRFDPRFRSGEGRDLWLRCAVAGARFAVTRRATCQCTRGRGSETSRSGLQYAEQTAQFYEKHRDLAAVPAALRRRLLAGALVAQGRLLRTTDPTRAARCFWRAWSLQPVHVQTLGQFALTGSLSRPPMGEDQT